MDKLYIRVSEGIPIEHPMLEETLVQVFPDIDLNNLPNWVLPFQRIEPPPYDPIDHVYKVRECSYENVDGVVKDLWYFRDMTPEEKQEKIDNAKNCVILFPSWTFDETVCDYLPPTAMPNDGKQYYWDESTLSWILAPTPE
jgi:hypothetical protein